MKTKKKWSRRLGVLFSLIMLLGLLPTAVFADAGDVEINVTNFPDANFRAFLTEQSYGADGVITAAEIAAVEEIQCPGSSISDLKGIEIFTNLKGLNCGSNKLTALDVSDCTALEYLDCDYNELTTLNVSNCTALVYLECYENKLAALDVSDCTALEYLECDYNELTALNVSGCTALDYLECDCNELTALNVSGCTALEYLECYENKLTSLDLSNNTALNYLYCDNNIYSITVGSDRTFDLSTLPGSFDVSKASAWNGGTVSGTILTVDENAEEVTYTYDCGQGESVEFTLNVTVEQEPVSVELPFTVTVKQGGNVVPPAQTFELEVFDTYSNLAEVYPDVTVSASVDTNGVGSYNGTMTIQGPEDQMNRLIGRSFYIREKNTYAANWLYSDAVYEACLAPSSYAFLEEPANLELVLYPVELTTSDNGEYYDPTTDEPVASMAFENTYVREDVTFTVRKTDPTGKPLAGAVFALTGTGNSIDRNYEATSDANGIATFTVEDGYFGLLTEKTAPEGYVKSDDRYDLAIFDGKVFFYNENAGREEEPFTAYETLTFVNEKQATDPTEPSTEAPTTEAPTTAAPTTAASTTAASTGTTNAVKTGDSTNMLRWTVVLMVCVCGVAGCLIYSKRKNAK